MTALRKPTAPQRPFLVPSEPDFGDGDGGGGDDARARGTALLIALALLIGVSAAGLAILFTTVFLD